MVSGSQFRLADNPHARKVHPLADHVLGPKRVLDVGCGQGTQAVELARRGSTAVGVEPSPNLRERCRNPAHAAGVEVDLRPGAIESLSDTLGDERFDVVCAHGRLTYLDDRPAAIAALAERAEGSVCC